ncbi:MAG: hypothetical protein OXK82_07570 [Deltaproteobacteria bacterium]|nr:hypothetical protein [Deltaproteobacteria bacterium]
MNASEPQTNQEDVIGKLDVLIQHTAVLLKGQRGNARRGLMDWRSTLEDAKQSVEEGTTTEEQVAALVDRGCRLAGAFPADKVGHYGHTEVWMTTSEVMANNVAIVQQLGDLLRTQINGADPSP